MKFVPLLTLLACFQIFNFAVRANPISLSPESALVLYTGFPTGTIQQYTTAGAPVSTLPLGQLNDIPESIVILNGQVYVGDGAGKVNVINLSNGAGTTIFATSNFGLVALGDLNGSLLAINDTPNMIWQYSTSGVLLKSISLSSVPVNGWSGLTSDNSIIYLGDYNSGKIYEYSLAGTLLGSFDTHLGPGLVVGSYDFSNGSIWVTDGSGTYDITTAGVTLSSFAVPSRPFGVAIVPSSDAIPEPPDWGLLMVAIAALSALMLKRRGYSFGRIRV